MLGQTSDDIKCCIFEMVALTVVSIPLQHGNRQVLGFALPRLCFVEVGLSHIRHLFSWCPSVIQLKLSRTPVVTVLEPSRWCGGVFMLVERGEFIVVSPIGRNFGLVANVIPFSSNDDTHMGYIIAGANL